ncbi:MAG: hypothetical protein Fur0010_03240 [Bdellovibrio sp.]
MNKKAELTLAFQELASFLKANPELLEFQLEIERELENVGQDPEIRLGLLMSMLHQKIQHELLPHCEILQEMLNESSRKIQKFQKYSG